MIYKYFAIGCICTEHGFGWYYYGKPPKAMISGNAPIVTWPTHLPDLVRSKKTYNWFLSFMKEVMAWCID